MPNGGSDCCGTCLFNAKNKGKAGYAHARDPEPAYCVIRDLPLAKPFYTYCANHPHLNPEKISIPIGPAWKAAMAGSKSGFGYERVILAPSPDTEAVRSELLRLVREIKEGSEDNYLAWTLDDVVIWQLGEFRERRAVPDLQRIAAFDATKAARSGRINAYTIALAQEALQKIEGESSTES